MKAKYILLIACVGLLTLSGCASRKKAAGKKAKTTQTQTQTQTATGTVATTVAEPEKKVSKPTVKKKTIVEKALEAQPTFQSVSAQKAKCTINYQQRQISSGAAITLIKDSILIISVQPLLGIELVRVEATPQDIMLLDKMNKRYVQMNYEEAAKELGLPITFADIQAIAMDHLFVLGKDAAFIASQKQITSAAGKSTLHIEEGKIVYDFLIDETQLMLKQTKLGMTGRKGTATIDYADHSAASGVLFPTTLNIAYTGTKNEMSAKITLPNLTFNTIVNANRANLRSYQKTTISAILTGK